MSFMNVEVKVPHFVKRMFYRPRRHIKPFRPHLRVIMRSLLKRITPASRPFKRLLAFESLLRAHFFRSIMESSSANVCTKRGLAPRSTIRDMTRFDLGAVGYRYHIKNLIVPASVEEGARSPAKCARSPHITAKINDAVDPRGVVLWRDHPGQLTSPRKMFGSKLWTRFSGKKQLPSSRREQHTPGMQPRKFCQLFRFQKLHLRSLVSQTTVLGTTRN